MYSMPVVDIRDLSTSPSRFGAAVREGMERDGFLAVIGHGITSELLGMMTVATDKLFAFEDAILEERYGCPGVLRQRGYTPLLTEQAVGATVPDLKRFWMTVLEEDPEDPEDNPYGMNVWPEEVPEFEDLTLELLGLGVECGRAILRGLEIGFDLPTGRLVNITFGSETMLRTICYPPLDASVPPGSVRSAAHGDINLITVLPIGADEEGRVDPGLELLLNGVWNPVVLPDGAIPVNIGEMIAEVEGITGLTPTIHRVVNPPGQARFRRRLSWPIFIHARPSVFLRPGLRAGDWFGRRIREITKR